MTLESLDELGIKAGDTVIALAQPDALDGLVRLFQAS
jgi:hypothetical protein